MMRLFLPGILLAAAIGIFYFFSNPEYQDIKMLQAELTSYNDALDNAKKLQEIGRAHV